MTNEELEKYLAAHGGEALTPQELHVVWVATVTYLTSIHTGELTMITDEDKWIVWLNSAVEKLSRAKNTNGVIRLSDVEPETTA